VEHFPERPFGVLHPWHGGDLAGASQMCFLFQPSFCNALSLYQAEAARNG
jgi:hypothetical protein